MFLRCALFTILSYFLLFTTR
ncbi:hypothetical protein LINPERPRIM_LOCUS15011 [Linum perenne]